MGPYYNLDKYKDDKNGMGEIFKSLKRGIQVAGGRLSLGLQYADIIRISAPSNEKIHLHHFFVDYIDQEKLRCVDIAQVEEQYTYKIEWDPEEKAGFLLDTSIEQISLITRSPELGYIQNNRLKQNDLITIEWTNAQIPSLHAKIRNIVLDCIEIIDLETTELLYIDFEYKGLPDFIHKLRVTSSEEISPSTDEAISSLTVEEDISSAEMGKTALQTLVRQGDTLLREIVSMDDIAEDLDAVEIEMEIPEHLQRYTLDVQIEDLSDHLYSRYPKHLHTPELHNTLSTEIARFVELRKKFSEFQENGIILPRKTEVRPFLKQYIQNNDEYPYRVFVPIVNLQKKIVLDCEDEELATEPAFSISLEDDELDEMVRLWNNYKKNVQRGDENRLDHLLRSLIQPPFLKPMFPRNNLFYTPVKTRVPQEYWIAEEYDPTVSLHINVIKNSRGENCAIFGTHTVDFVKQRFLKGEEAAISSFYVPDLHTILATPTLATPFYQETTLLLPPSTRDTLRFISLENDDEWYEQYDERVLLFFQKPSKQRPPNIPPPYGSRPTCFYIKPSGRGDVTHLSKMEVLQAITPTTHYLLQHLKHTGYLDDVYSLQQAVRRMTGWAIELENIRRTEGHVITTQIDKNIRAFMKNWRLRSGELLKQAHIALGYYKSANVPWNNLYKLFPPSIIGSNLMEYFTIAYNIDINSTSQTTVKYTNSEFFNALLQVDNGRLFHLCLISLLLDWLTPEQFLSGVPDIQPTVLLPSSEQNKVIKTLSKRYTQEADMEHDNQPDTPVYVDADLLDGTTQEWIRKFEPVLKKAKSEEEKREIVHQTLTDVQQMTPQAADELTETILSGKRLVEDGEYAVLEKKQRAVYGDNQKKHKDVVMYRRYYKRIQGIWRLDEKLNDEDFGEDIHNLLYTSKQRGLPAETKQAILFEFERRYSKIAETMKEQIQEDIQRHLQEIVRKREWQQAREQRLNRAMIQQAMLYAEEKKTAVISPYAVLRDLLMDQTHEAKRQYDIVRFFEQYCRKATLTENPNWGYCRLTNTPLFPLSIYEMATVFNTGKTRDYHRKIEEVRSQYGILSEDGGRWVDRVSGYTICLLDQVADGSDTVEYRRLAVADQERKEAEIQLAIETLFTATTTTTTTEEGGNDVVSVLYRFLNRQMGIQEGPGTLFQEIQVLYQNTLQDPRIVTTPEKYEKLLTKSPPGKMPPYKTYLDRMQVYTAVSSFFVTMQLHSHQIKRSNLGGPVGCSFTLKGYPQINNPEKDDGIHYMACLLQDTAKIDERPWKSMNQQSVKVMMKNIKIVLQTMVTNTPSLKNALKAKEAAHPQDKEEVEIQEHIHRGMHWYHFLPPITPFSVKQQVQQEEQARSLYLDEFAQSRKNKDDAVRKLKDLSRLITYAAVERINDIVVKKKLLMRTMKGTPFLENACCDDDTRSRNPAFYFCQEDPTLLTYIQLTREIDRDLHKIANISYPPLLFYRGLSWTTTFQTSTPLLQETTLKILFLHHLYDRGLWKRPDIQSLYPFPRPPENYSRDWTPVAKMAMFQETLEQSGKWTEIRPMYRRFIQKINQDHIQTKRPEYDVVTLRTERQQAFIQVLEVLVVSDETRSQTLYTRLWEWQTEKEATPFTVNKIQPYRKHLLSQLEKDGINIPKLFLTLDDKLDVSSLRNRLTYLKNSLWYITRYNPWVVLQKDNEGFPFAPEHWVFHSADKKRIEQQIIKNTRFYRPGDFQYIQPLIQQVLEKVVPIQNLLKTLPEELFSLEILWHLYSYFLVEVVYLHLETYYEMTEGEDTNVQRVLKDYLETVLEKTEKTGQWMEMTYEKIREKTQVDVDMEKNTMKQYLKEMTNEERKVENEMKKNKLGKWNVGKEVYIYDKRKPIIGIGTDIQSIKARLYSVNEEIRDALADVATQIGAENIRLGEEREEGVENREEVEDEVEIEVNLEEEEEDGGYDVDEGYDDNGNDNDDDFGYEE